VTGGIRERNEYAAAKLSKEKAIVNLKEIEVQLGNALGTSILKVNNLRASAENHRTVISFHRQLLENQVTRLGAGVIDSRTVLETEEKLFEARIALLDARSRATIEDLVRRVEKIETAIEPQFQAHFVDAMAIPHRTADYPSLRKVVDLPAATPTASGGEGPRRRARRAATPAQPV